MNHILLAVISLFWGSSFILMKWATLSFGPITIGALRVLGGACILWVFWLFIKPQNNLTVKKVFYVFGLSVVGYIYPFTLQPYLVGQYDSGFIGMSVSFVPLATILVSIPLLKKFPNVFEWIAVIGGMAFVGIMSKDGFNRDYVGIHLLLLLTVPLSYAMGNTFVKREFQNTHPLIISCLCMTFASIILIPCAVIAEDISQPQHLVQAGVAVGILGLISTGTAGFLFYKLIYRAGPLQAGFVGYTIPTIALIWGWLAGEQVTLLQIISLVGILIMVAIGNKKPKKLKPQK